MSIDITGEPGAEKAKPGIKPGECVPQPHGGAIRNGSMPGTNGGGTGRPANLIRQAMREGYAAIADDMIPAMQAISVALGVIVDPEADEEAQYQAELLISKLQKVGWTVDQVTKAWARIGEMGLPKQTQAVLPDSEVLLALSSAVIATFKPSESKLIECMHHAESAMLEYRG